MQEIEAEIIEVKESEYFPKIRKKKEKAKRTEPMKRPIEDHLLLLL